MINLIQTCYLDGIIRFTPLSSALTLRQMLTNVACPDLSKVDFSTHWVGIPQTLSPNCFIIPNKKEKIKQYITVQ